MALGLWRRQDDDRAARQVDRYRFIAECDLVDRGASKIRSIRLAVVMVAPGMITEDAERRGLDTPPDLDFGFPIGVRRRR
jgi:hypothetical protein